MYVGDNETRRTGDIPVATPTDGHSGFQTLQAELMTTLQSPRVDSFARTNTTMCQVIHVRDAGSHLDQSRVLSLCYRYNGGTIHVEIQ